jgi:hypothetical protein
MFDLQWNIRKYHGLGFMAKQTYSHIQSPNSNVSMLWFLIHLAHLSLLRLQNKAVVLYRCASTYKGSFFWDKLREED